MRGAKAKLRELQGTEKGDFCEACGEDCDDGKQCGRCQGYFCRDCLLEHKTECGEDIKRAT